MHRQKHLKFLISIFMSTSMILAGCGPSATPTPEILIQTVIVESTPQMIEQQVTPEPTAETFENGDKSALVNLVQDFSYYVSFDPAFNYQEGGGTIIMNVYETLIFYERQFPDRFIPQLATEWEISEDVRTYTFKIREGVQFHGGQDLTPEDVAYSFQRALLQGGSYSPMWLLTEPFFGVGVYDVTYLIDPELEDDPEALVAVDPETLLQTCQQVTDAIVADEEGGTVTLALAQPWAPFLQIIAAGWGSIVDKGWAIEQGVWDGDCGTWQNYYSPEYEANPLHRAMNGTGPYKLDHYKENEELLLLRNENYWRTEPAWEGGPVGPAAVESVTYKVAPQIWAEQFTMIRKGEVDFFPSVAAGRYTEYDPLIGEQCDYNPDTFDFDCSPTENPQEPLRLYRGHPMAGRNDALFKFDIHPEDNFLLGSGELDGEGIPPNFFADEHVRRAFNYCFNFDAYIQEMWQGKAIQNVGVILPGMIGYDPDGSKYSYDLQKCQEEIEQAFDGKIADEGFRVLLPYRINWDWQRIPVEILEDGFWQIDEKYNIDVIGLAASEYWSLYASGRIPILMAAWGEDYHDPHAWVEPFLAGMYASRQSLPEDFTARFSELIDAGISTMDPDERAQIYGEIQQLDYELSIAIRGVVPTGRTYLRGIIEGWYYNPIYFGPYYYVLSIK